MNFEIKPNEKVAFVGKSGAGKTTIFSLITKLYSLNEGKILLDGYNIDDLTCDSLYCFTACGADNKIGILPSLNI